MAAEKWEEYQVVHGDAQARDIRDWTVFATSPAHALERAREEQQRGGGRGPIDVRGPLAPCCDVCGDRHRPPPSPLERDSYCR
jgi:hypothetical protein